MLAPWANICADFALEEVLHFLFFCPRARPECDVGVGLSLVYRDTVGFPLECMRARS